MECKKDSRIVFVISLRWMERKTEKRELWQFYKKQKEPAFEDFEGRLKL